MSVIKRNVFNGFKLFIWDKRVLWVNARHVALRHWLISFSSDSVSNFFKHPRFLSKRWKALVDFHISLLLTLFTLLLQFQQVWASLFLLLRLQFTLIAWSFCFCNSVSRFAHLDFFGCQPRSALLNSTYFWFFLDYVRFFNLYFCFNFWVLSLLILNMLTLLEQLTEFCLRLFFLGVNIGAQFVLDSCNLMHWLVIFFSVTVMQNSNSDCIGLWLAQTQKEIAWVCVQELM